MSICKVFQMNLFSQPTQFIYFESFPIKEGVGVYSAYGTETILFNWVYTFLLKSNR